MTACRHLTLFVCAINFLTSTTCSVDSLFGVNNESIKSIPTSTSRFFVKNLQKPKEQKIVNTVAAQFFNNVGYVPETVW